MYPIRILHVVGIMNRGGLETFIMNLYRNIDRDKIQFDFIVHREEEGIFEKEIIDLGGKIYRIPHINKVGPIVYVKNLKKFFEENKDYKIVHSHMNAMSGIILREAKKAGIPNRIAHSHTSYPKMGKLEQIYKGYSKLFINKNSTKRFACSDIAGKWLYGKNTDFEVVKNGINIKEFMFNSQIREKKRKDFDIDRNTLVLGHIGSFRYPKNHEFLVDIFLEVKKYNDNSILMLVGDGPLKTHIEDKVKKLQLEDSVIFTGVREDIDELLQVLDLMVFPSRYEGLGLTLVEAQANGLKCIVSDTITTEVDMNMNLVEFISLKEGELYWAQQIKKVKNLERYENTLDQIKKRGYSIMDISKNMQILYLKMAKNNQL